jgi:hypothetical protein
MIASLFAMLLASAQPAPTEEPVATEAEAPTEVQADMQADVSAEPAVEAEAQATVTAEAEAAPAAPEEEIVCRRRVIPAERIGQRLRTVRDCRPASEWPATSRRRGG